MSIAEQNTSQAIPGSRDNTTTFLPLKFPYRSHIIARSFILSACFLLLGFYFINHPEALNGRYEALVFALGYGTLLAGLSPYATPQRRTLIPSILYGTLVFWFIFLISQIAVDGPLAWLHYEKVPLWLEQVLGGAIIILGIWFLIWTILNLRLLRHGNAVTITSQGLILNDRSPAISWDRITRAQMLFNPAWPKQKTTVRLFAPGFSGTPMRPYGSLYLRRQGQIVIPIMLIANRELLINKLTHYLGSRFEK